MTWMASVSGASIELLRPVVAEVNFRDMAVALSQLNRYAGQSAATVSVAQHLIIGCDIAPPAIRPWWLLHDSHEERLGDTISPVKEMHRALAEEMFGAIGVQVIESVRKEAEARHDAVIHAAAGLPRPSNAQIVEIKRIDLIALATEKRDFHAAQTRRWWIDEHKVPTHSRVYRPLPAAKAAEQLYALFTRYLPALAGVTGRVA